MKRLLVALALTITLSSVVVGHTQQSAKRMPSDPKATPAYRTLILHKAAVEAELAGLSGMFTARHPDVQSKRLELSLLRLELEKMQSVGKSGAPKLSHTYGDLILRKVSLKVEFHNLLQSFKPQHPDVEKKRLELAALEREIENVLR